MTEPPESVDVDASIALAPDPQSPARARRFITEFCVAAQLPPRVCETAALLTSELVTNAVVHGRSRATLHAHQPPGLIRVSVQDRNPALPAAGDAPALLGESGRGLAIVARLATRWGVETTPSGKAVWFELAI